MAVRSIRLSSKLTLAQLSEKTSIQLSTLSRSEVGQRDIGYTEMQSITEALGVTERTICLLAEKFEKMGLSQEVEVIRSKQRELNRNLGFK